MKLSQEEKIEKFMEGAKTTALSTYIVKRPRLEYIQTVANEHGYERWIYFATVAALGSIIVKKMIEFEEDGKIELISTYKEAINEWDEEALDLIEELTRFVISKDVYSQEQFYESLGTWVFEKTMGSTPDLNKEKPCQWVGWCLSTDMELSMLD